jgi:type I restriction enzyme S subunit
MTAEDLRKAILQQAIQGKLVPQDPNDEPASVLLERIREEKARLVKEKKIKKDKNESIIYKGEDNSHYEKIIATGEIKCIDDEVPFEIPNTWEWVRLSNVSIIQEGPGIRSFQYKPDGIQLLTVTNILEGYVDLQKSRKYISEIEYNEKYSHFQVNIGDIVCACSGGSWGKSAIYGIPDHKIILNTSTLRLRFFDDLADNGYLYMMTKTFLFKKQLSDQLSGMQPNFGYAHYSKILIPIPPLNEQKRIAQRIEEIQPLIDKYRIAQEQAEEMDNALQPQLKKSILQYAIQGKLVPQDSNDEPASILLERIREEKARLVKEKKIKKDKNESIIYKGEDNSYYEKTLATGEIKCIDDEIPFEIPNSWNFVRLHNLCWLDDGCKSNGEKLPYMDAKYHRGKSDIIYITQGKIVKPPCKVILVDGENSGEIFDVKEKGYLGSTFKVLQISKCISKEWLHMLLNTYRELFKNSKIGAAIPHLNKNLFRNLIVGLPPLQEQRRIVAKIEKILNLQ